MKQTKNNQKEKKERRTLSTPTSGATKQDGKSLQFERSSSSSVDTHPSDNIHRPKTIEEAINDLLEFFECDIWYAKSKEWKTEEKMIKYLRVHFGILEDQIRDIKRWQKKP